MENKENGLIESLPKELKKKVEDTVKNLKEEHKIDDVWVFVSNKVKPDGEPYIGYAKRVESLTEMSRYISYVTEDPVVANHKLAEMCLLPAGDRDYLITEKGYLSSGLFAQISQVIEQTQSEFKVF